MSDQESDLRMDVKHNKAREGDGGETHELEETRYHDVGEDIGAHHNHMVAPDGEDVIVTAKTWVVIFILSVSFGVSFWPVPTVGAMGTPLAVKLGDATGTNWFTPAYTVAIAVCLLLVGGNSDLFGRRWFLIGGNIICVVGHITAATAHSTNQMIAGMAIVGFGGGCAEMAMFAIFELVPNKWRHIGVIMADGGVYFVVVVGPIVGRVVMKHGSAWRFVFIAAAIVQALSGAGLFWLYFPPKHPRGVPWRDALYGMDWIGMALFTPALTIALVGIVLTTYMSASDRRVIATLCVGFGLMVCFGLWEQFGKIKYPLCPTHVFTRNKGRSFTAPFVAGTIIGMTYFAINIIYPTCINVFYVTADTSFSEILALTLPGNLGLCLGAFLLGVFGHRVRHYHYTYIISTAGVVLFGGLIAVVTPHNRGTIIAFTFLEQTFYGWAGYLTYAYVQQGVPQIELGIAGGLCGVMRFVGGSLGQAIYTTVLVNTQKERAAKLIPAAALEAGLPAASLDSFMAAFPTNTTALATIKGATPAVLAAAGSAFQYSYAHALRILALMSIAFGGVTLIAVICCEDIDAKFNDRIEVFLENDRLAEKNKYH